MALAWRVRYRVGWSVAGIVCTVALIGAALMQRVLHPVLSPDDIRHRLATRDAVLCEGLVAARPERMAERARVVVAVERCRDGETMTPTRGRTLLYAPQLPAAVEHGSRVRFRTTLHAPTRFLNPGTATFGLKWEADGVVAVGSLPEPQWITVIEDAAGPVLRRMRAGRQSAERALQSLSASPEVIGVLRAMILGQGDALEQLWWDRFRRVGVVHLLVVSGLHIAAVAGVLYWGLGWLARRSSWLMLRVPLWRVTALLAIAGSWLYTWLTGANIPAQRAAWFVTVLFAGIVLDRRHDLWNALALSAVILLMASPLVLWIPSFQLTFAAVAAIAACEGLRRRRAGPSPTLRTRLVAGLGVTCAATLGVTPIVAYHFHETSLMGILTNLLLVPLVSAVITPLGLLFICLAPSVSWAAVLVGMPLIWLTTAFTAATTWLDQWSGPWQLSWVPLRAELLLWYIGCVGVVLWIVGVRWRHSQRWWWRALMASAVVVSIIAVGTRMRLRYDARLRVTVLDVGQGSAALVRFPNGRVYMIDGGGIPRSTFDLGRWVVAPTLRRLQIDHVDRLIMTHYHPDHYPGLAYVAEAFGAAQLNVNGSAAASDDAQWQEFAERLGRTAVTSHILNVTAPAWNEGDVRVRVIHPGPPASLAELNENDRSIVLELTHRDVRLLFTGDIEAAAEQHLLDHGVLQPVDVVVVPHHGSDTSSTPPWVQAVRPRYAVISCGRQNRYGFPRAAVLQTYAQQGTTVFRTDLHGAVSVVSDGHTVSVDPFVKSPLPPEPTTR